MWIILSLAPPTQSPFHLGIINWTEHCTKLISGSWWEASLYECSGRVGGTGKSQVFPDWYLAIGVSVHACHVNINFDGRDSNGERSDGTHTDIHRL